MSLLQKRQELAKEASEIIKEGAEIIEDHAENTQYSYSVELTADNGKKYTQHCPWVGYFEHIDHVGVKKVIEV